MFTVPSSKRQPILRWHRKKPMTEGQIHRFIIIETLWHYGSIHISSAYDETYLNLNIHPYSSPSIFIHIQYQFTSGQANIPSQYPQFFWEISPPESSDVHPTSSSMCCWWRSMKRWTQAPFTASDCGANCGAKRSMPKRGKSLENMMTYVIIYICISMCTY